MTAAELRRRMQAAEFNEWVALYRLEARERGEAQKKASNKGRGRGRRPRRR